MQPENVIIRVPADVQESLLTLLRPEDSTGALTIKRVSAWRSAGVPWTEILIALTSAGSLTAIGTVVKALLDRTRGKIEIISEQTGHRVTFEGPLDRLPVDEIKAVLKPSNPAKAHPESPSQLTHSTGAEQPDLTSEI
jgi:hypothetical protein